MGITSITATKYKRPMVIPRRIILLAPQNHEGNSLSLKDCAFIPINSCSYEINDLQEIELIPIGIHQQFLQRSLGREIIFHARLQWMHEDWWAASEVCYCAQRAV